MPRTYFEQLRALGVPSQQLPAAELQDKLVCGDPSFTLDIEPNLDPDDPYVVKFCYSPQGATGPAYLTHYVATLYHPDTDDIFRCRTFPVLGETAVPMIREAKNLLQGRAVWKLFYPGTPLEYAAWLWLDFSRRDAEAQYKLLVRSASNGRKLENILPKYPIEELGDPEYTAIIINALQSGELVGVRLRQGGATPSPKVLEYDPRLSILKLHTPAHRVPTINIHLIKDRLVWL
jgi:hypothetical protein